MSFFSKLNKTLLFIIYSLFFLFIIFLIFLINSKEPRDKDTRRILKSIIKKGTISQHIFNDYREGFLPSTQFININFKKIDLDFLKLNIILLLLIDLVFLDMLNLRRLSKILKI